MRTGQEGVHPAEVRRVAGCASGGPGQAGRTSFERDASGTCSLPGWWSSAPPVEAVWALAQSVGAHDRKGPVVRVPGRGSEATPSGRVWWTSRSCGGQPPASVGADADRVSTHSLRPGGRGDGRPSSTRQASPLSPN